MITSTNAIMHSYICQKGLNVHPRVGHSAPGTDMAFRTFLTWSVLMLEGQFDEKHCSPPSRIYEQRMASLEFRLSGLFLYTDQERLRYGNTLLDRL